MDNKNNMDECMWMIMGSIHESDRITVAKCLDMMEEKGIVGPSEGSKPRSLIMSETAIAERFFTKNPKKEADFS